MSLLITSSTQDRYLDDDLPIENAYSYKNFLSNPTIIPKNSAVCVQSIKFNRRGNFVIKESDYFGYLLNSKAHSDATTLPNNNVMTPIGWDMTPGNYSTNQFASVIATGFNKALNIHPDFEDATVEKTHTAGKFTGFKFTTVQKAIPTDQTALLKAYPIIDIHNQSGIGGNGQIPYTPVAGFPTDRIWTGGLMNADSTVPFTADVATYAYAGGIGTFACGDGNEGFTLMYSPTVPLSLQGGGYQVSVNHYGGAVADRTITSYEWVSSLCRPMAVGYDAVANVAGDGDWHDYHAIGATIPPWTDGFNPNVSPNMTKYGNWTQFGDYWCSVRLNPTTDAHELRVGYYGRRPATTGSIPQTNANKWPAAGRPNLLRFMNNNDTAQREDLPEARPTEIQYWNAVGTAVKTTTIAPAPIVDGPYNMGLNANVYTAFRWELKGENVSLWAVRAGGEDFVVDFATAPLHSFPPISQNQVRMYPKLMVHNEAEGPGTSELKISLYLGRDMSENSAYENSIDHYGSGFYETHLNGTKDGHSQEIDRRGVSSDPAFNPAAVYTRVGYDAATQVIDYKQQYVMGFNETIRPASLIQNPEPNLQVILGYNLSFITGIDTALSRGGATLESAVPPESTGQEHSLFIRCPTLTQISHNFGKGGMSKILHHIPQFDNTGKSTGALFFENTNPMYIRLGNTDEIMLNELQIDIVDRDERYAYELDGSTIVVLHIKPESNI